MKFDQYDYKVSGHYLSALINDDYSGLDDDDEKALREFQRAAYESATKAGFTVGHWDSDNDDNGEDFGTCDVTGLYSGRIALRLMVYRTEGAA